MIMLSGMVPNFIFFNILMMQLFSYLHVKSKLWENSKHHQTKESTVKKEVWCLIGVCVDTNVTYQSVLEK